MDQNVLLLLVVVAAVGLLAVILILARQARERRDADRESPFGTSTEGEKVCPRCGGQNLWTEATCIYCKGPLKG
jgi:hypothetical protein